MRNNSKGCNVLNAFFIGIKGIVCCTCGHLLVECESRQHFHKWRLDAFSIQNYVIKKGRPCGARHGKTEAQKEHFVAIARGGDVSKRILLEFTIASNEIQFSAIRNSKFSGPRRSASRWIKLAQQDHSCCPSSEEYERYKKNWHISLNKSGRNAPMKLRSDFEQQSQLRTVSTENLEKNDLNQSLFINTKDAFVFFFQYLMVAVE